MARQSLPSPYATLVSGAPVTRSQVTLCGGTTHLWQYGSDRSADHLVVLHGFRGDHHGLEPVVAHLLRERPGLRVTVPDLPGFGASPPLPDGRHDVPGYAAWARDLVREVAPGGTAALAGHSFGSVVAAAAMSGTVPGGQEPAAPLARALVLINPIPRPPVSGRGRLGVGATAALHSLAGALPETAGTALLRHAALTRIASVAMVRTPEKTLTRWIHEEHDRYFAGFATRRSLLTAFRASITGSVREWAAGVEVPTLLVGGARDDLAPASDQKELTTAFRDARLVLVPGVGHLTHYETPDAVAREIAAFLSEA
ncbi:Pimeloyl-ACP methyl ester carboxylesterase [Promicromonospora umidemergens]|uniref:AB hydrolase-1 domain-containing protein n=1 Tax=Promicromonospora umidemergens TaxID=629679 RepID=A0ABP8YC03_9MICO|nr:alpha/beta hydrolase [Promicromonospora umidemergens]MCP2284681.1 Pimeloyl-ACP methyl ester carboxylesterase [Promicromonospora umidemergens]